MSILDIKEKSSLRHNLKPVWIYFAISIFAIFVNKIYALFGHGVSSSSMTWMFLYPLLGGAALFLLVGLLLPELTKMSGYRLFCNIYNSGIAIVTVGSFLKGIVEIAGTNSNNIMFFRITGWGFIIVGLVLLVSYVIRLKEN